MISQLSLHTYVFLGNALKVLSQPAKTAPDTEPDPTTAFLQTLYATIEPLNPSNILPAIDQLAPVQREFLSQAAQWCLTHLDESDFVATMGLPKELAEEVAQYLASAVPATPPTAGA